MDKWKIKRALNTMPDGTCRTLKSQYHKNSAANFIRGGDLRSNRSFKMQKIKRIVLGMIDSKGFEQDNRVYYKGGVAPTERANNSTINIVRKIQNENNNSTKGEAVKPKENRIRQSNPKGL